MDEQGPDPAPEPPLLPTHPLRVTWALVAANVAIFALESLWGGSEWSPTLYRMGAGLNRASLLEEPWRVLSSAFLHIGLAHLLLNMWALLVFGRGLESLLGHWRLLVLYATSALGGGLTSTLGHGLGPHLSAGASGAVWGLMVAELVVLLRPRVLFEDIVFVVNKGNVLMPLVVNLLFSLQPGIDLLGHLGGGAAGGLLMASGLLARAPDAPAWRRAACVAGLVMAFSIGLAFQHGRPWELLAPRLEPRRLPTGAIVVPVPRGLAEERGQDGAAIFGNLRHDPLMLECRWHELDRPLADADRRQFLMDMVEEASHQALPSGYALEAGPAVVDLGGRPAYHLAAGVPSGARQDVWYMVDGTREVRLLVVQGPDLPPAWKAVPEQIARGVVFER